MLELRTEAEDTIWEIIALEESGASDDEISALLDAVWEFLGMYDDDQLLLLTMTLWRASRFLFARRTLRSLLGTRGRCGA